MRCRSVLGELSTRMAIREQGLESDAVNQEMFYLEVRKMIGVACVGLKQAGDAL